MLVYFTTKYSGTNYSQASCNVLCNPNGQSPVHYSNKLATADMCTFLDAVSGSRKWFIILICLYE